MRTEPSIVKELVWAGFDMVSRANNHAGDFGVLPRHAPLISALRPGFVHIHTPAGILRLFVTGGFAEVTPTSCTILADHIEDMEGMDITKANERLRISQQKLKEAASEQQLADAEKEVGIAEEIVRLVSLH